MLDLIEKHKVTDTTADKVEILEKDGYLRLFQTQPEYNVEINGKAGILKQLCSWVIAQVRYHKLASLRDQNISVKRSPLAVDVNFEGFYDCFQVTLSSMSMVVNQLKRLMGKIEESMTNIKPYFDFLSY